MKILVASIGTRGDMEPFLAIGELLKKRGHDVYCMFPEQFRNLAEESGFDFITLGPEFMAMLESDVGKFALGGGGSKFRKILAYIKLARVQITNNKRMTERQYKAIVELKPDRIVHNGKVMYPVIWEVEHPGKTVYISPVPYLHYVKGHTHTAFHSNYGEFLNKLTYTLSDWGILKALIMTTKFLNIQNVSKQQIKTALNEHKIVYTISPQLFKRPEYWANNLNVLGYHERDKTVQWKPDAALNQFLEKHSKIIFITFGSMTNPEPENKTHLLLNILTRNNIPAIINTSSGGLVEPKEYNKELIHFVAGIPYDWIFPKMYAVVHHGGSGTTHMTLKYGCASLIIPHIIDQFIWNDIAVEKGVGPKGISIGDITEKNLEPKIRELVENKSYKEKATELGNRMQAENFEDDLYAEIINI